MSTTIYDYTSTTVPIEQAYSDLKHEMRALKLEVFGHDVPAINPYTFSNGNSVISRLLMLEDQVRRLEMTVASINNRFIDDRDWRAMVERRLGAVITVSTMPAPAIISSSKSSVVEDDFSQRKIGF